MRLLTICTLALALAVSPAFAQGKGRGKGRGGRGGPALTLTSTSFPDGSMIPDKYTSASPMPVSPELSWTNVPMGTVTFMLLLHDPDVVLGGNWQNDVTHWIVWNIPGTATSLHEGIEATAQMPDGMIQGKNTANRVGFLGPGAPASGPPHHYTFELYALDTKLDLGPDASRADVMMAINGHILGKAVYVGRFMQH
jgi:Raf kinase inhibitor-like YbhB/YbcL family protein